MPVPKTLTLIHNLNAPNQELGRSWKLPLPGTSVEKKLRAPVRFAPHDKCCDILRAAIKSRFSADTLSLRDILSLFTSLLDATLSDVDANK